MYFVVQIIVAMLILAAADQDPLSFAPPKSIKAAVCYIALKQQGCNIYQIVTMSGVCISVQTNIICKYQT